MAKTILFTLLLVPFFAFGQFADCNSTGPLLEKQITTTLGAGLLRSTGSCVRGAVVNGGLEMVGANVSIIDGDTVGQVLRWTGTDWETRLIIFPAADGGVDTVYNGLTDRDTAFVLGGPLVEHTTITGQQAYDFYLSNMRTIYMEAQRTSGVAFSSVTMGSTAVAGVDFAHYNEADNQKQAVAAVNYSTGNVMKVQDSATNGTYFQQYDNGGGLFQTDITSSNGATSKTIRVNRDAVFVINLEHLDISNEAAFMMIDTFTGELKYKSPADFAGLYGDDWGGQAVSSTARFSGVGTVGSPLELAQQSATSGQVLKWSGSAWTPGTDASGTTYTAENGTYLDGTILKLGTPLTENTAIDGAGFTLGVTDASNVTLSATGSFGITSTLSVDEFSSSLSILNGSTESLFSGNGTQSYMSHENNSTGATARVMAENYRKIGLQYYPTGGTPTLEYFLDGGATVPGHYQVGMRYKSSGDTILATDATTGEIRRRPLSVTPAQITNGTTGSFLRSGASVPAWETAASLQGSLLLPTGTNRQTLRNASGTWVANSLLENDGNYVGINVASPSANRLHIQETDANRHALKVTTGAGNSWGVLIETSSTTNNTIPLRIATGTDANGLYFDARNYFGIGTVPDYPLHIKNAANAVSRFEGTGATSPTGIDMINTSQFWRIGMNADGNPYNDFHFRNVTAGATAANLYAISIRSDNSYVGIGVLSAAQTIHVAGTARITGSDGTATTITGRDADGDISNVGIGAGIALSSGNIQADIGSGLNISGNDIAWGGTLTENTTVDVDGFDLEFVGLPTATTEEDVMLVGTGGLLVKGTIPITAIRAPGEATYSGANGATGETVTWQPEDVNVDADPTAGHLTVELNGGMYTGVHYSLFGCCNLTYNIILSGTMKLTGEYGTVASYTLTAGQHLEVVKFSDNSFRVSKK